MTDKIQLSTIQVKPKYLAQKCPVCNGWSTVSFKRIACHACLGKGYILIPVETEREKIYEAVKPLKYDIKKLKDSNFAHFKAIIELINKTKKLDIATLAQNKLVNQKIKRLSLIFLLALILSRLDVIFPVIRNIFDYYKSLFSRKSDDLILGLTIFTPIGILLEIFIFSRKKRIFPK